MTRVHLDGTYTAEHVSPGEYTVIPMLAGYLSPMNDMIRSQMAGSTPAMLRENLLALGTVTVHGGETQNIDVLLQRGGAVSGQVLYSDGSPASGINIEVDDVKDRNKPSDEDKRMTSFAAMLLTHESLSTNDQGRFRVAGLKPGTYRIAANSTQNSNSDTNAFYLESMFGGGPTSATLRIYSGDTLHKKDATTYTLRSGQEVSGLTITVPLNAFHQVRGSISSKDGRAINKAIVTLSDAVDDNITFKTQVDAGGVFVFDAIPSGTYSLAATNAQIVVYQNGANLNVPLEYAPNRPTNAFADGNTSLLLKDSDVLDLTVTLIEVPLPPQPTQPQEDEDVPAVPVPGTPPRE